MLLGTCGASSAGLGRCCAKEVAAAAAVGGEEGVPPKQGPQPAPLVLIAVQIRISLSLLSEVNSVPGAAYAICGWRRSGAVHEQCIAAGGRAQR